MAPLILLACAPEPGSAAGRLIDARTDQPIADAVVRFSTDQADCAPADAQTDEAGHFSVQLPCTATYTALPADPEWYVPEPVPAGPSMELRAWRAGASPGVYTLSDRALTPLYTHTVLDTVYAFGTTEEILFPVEIPGAVPRIAGDTVLLDVGGVLGDTLRFEPLVASAEKRWFGTKEAPQPVDPWMYLGVRFTSDTAFERVPASADPAHVQSVGTLRYISGDALPAGRYALVPPGATRAFILDFGITPRN